MGIAQMNNQSIEKTLFNTFRVFIYREIELFKLMN